MSFPCPLDSPISLGRRVRSFQMPSKKSERIVMVPCCFSRALGTHGREGKISQPVTKTSYPFTRPIRKEISYGRIQPTLEKDLRNLVLTAQTSPHPSSRKSRITS